MLEDRAMLGLARIQKYVNETACAGPCECECDASLAGVGQVD
jgi:hypothetical protein